MPARAETTSAIGTAPAACDVYDMDNIFLTDEGWVYRHYKKADFSEYWDEIIVAGEVVAGATINGVDNDPVHDINEASPTFETGDGQVDITYSPTFVGNAGGGARHIDATTITPNDANQNTGDTVDYTANVTGDVTNLQYAWVVQGGQLNSYADGQVGINVTWNVAGDGKVILVVGTTDPNWDEDTSNIGATLDVTVTD